MIDGGLGKEFKKHLVGWHLVRIETGLTVLGVPDMNFCHNDIEGWIENKGPKTPVLQTQVNWITRRRQSGGRVFVAVRCAKVRGKRIPGFSLYSGDDVAALAVNAQVKPIVSAEGDRPGSWPWEEIAQALLHFSFLSV